MSDTRPDQTEEILSYEISDEELETAAGIKRAANYTLYYCTALDLCPGPWPLRNGASSNKKSRSGCSLAAALGGDPRDVWGIFPRQAFEI